MNLLSIFHAFVFLAPFLVVLALLGLAARFTVYRRPPCSLEDVAFFVRQVDMLELTALLDPLVPRTLRESLSDADYRRELDTHIRLIREYISRVNHNVQVIQNWVAGEYSRMEGKNPKDFSLHEQLVAEALQTATELRLYALAAQAKLTVWCILRIDRWPSPLQPRLPNLRVLFGVNLLANYRRLTEIMRILSREYRHVHREVAEAL